MRQRWMVVTGFGLRPKILGIGILLRGPQVQPIPVLLLTIGRRYCGDLAFQMRSRRQRETNLE